jgi:hypothetical protein
MGMTGHPPQPPTVNCAKYYENHQGPPRGATAKHSVCNIESARIARNDLFQRIERQQEQKE